MTRLSRQQESLLSGRLHSEHLKLPNIRTFIIISHQRTNLRQTNERCPNHHDFTCWVITFDSQRAERHTFSSVRRISAVLLSGPTVLHVQCFHPATVKQWVRIDQIQSIQLVSEQQARHEVLHRSTTGEAEHVAVMPTPCEIHVVIMKVPGVTALLSVQLLLMRISLDNLLPIFLKNVLQCL